MTTQILTLHVPEPIYHQLKRRAELAQRTVEAETVAVLATAVPGADLLSPELEEAIAPLPLLDDAALWRAARSSLAAEAAEQLETLHRQRQREGLTNDESQTLASLVRQYERALLVRAEAAALLRRRGHDVSSLVGGP